MLYQPNFCCNCGEEIGRIEWKLWTSRRFCETCEADFRQVDWLPRLGLLTAFVLGTLGFGSYLKTPENSAPVTNNPISATPANRSLVVKNETSLANPNIQNKNGVSNSMPAIVPNPANQPKEDTTALQKSVLKQIPQNIGEESVYFCGAQTVKGTPCTRKVKGAGRCWQHAGQPALLPKEKLRVSQ